MNSSKHNAVTSHRNSPLLIRGHLDVVLLPDDFSLLPAQRHFLWLLGHELAGQVVWIKNRGEAERWPQDRTVGLVCLTPEHVQWANTHRFVAIPFLRQRMSAFPFCAESHQQALITPLPKSVLPRILVLGPESSGKSTLVDYLKSTLGRQMKLTIVPEYIRDYYNMLGHIELDYEQVAVSGLVQYALEKLFFSFQPSELHVVDTNCATTCFWSQILYGQYPEWLWQCALGQNYILCSVLRPDLPWQPDPQRCQPKQADREHFFYQCLDYARQVSSKVLVLEGQGESRYASFMTEISKLVNVKRTS
ncbi:AAA family ATPase [Zooshikella harenae]|uniref:ATP-binding protein n=1 Tax=Zooshikella harenae TaxID=2827238 RepID=A0ABS5ZIG4_9GAMM|nr:ATP-binding protein [Zooshikella harenae]MBU2713755.1 ATP-binding protein [Zooshikella harenae]